MLRMVVDNGQQTCFPARGCEPRLAEGGTMPPRGVTTGSKRARQYEHITDSGRARGTSNDRAEETAARTVNSERSEAGESNRGGGGGRGGSRKSGGGGRQARARAGGGGGGRGRKRGGP